MNNWIFYVVALAIIVIAAWAIKKVTRCIVKTIAVAVILGVLAYAYYLLSREGVVAL